MQFNDAQASYLEARARGQKTNASLRYAKSTSKHLADWRRAMAFVQEEQAIEAAIAEEMAISRDDVINGLRRAVDIAEMQGDPNAMVRAYEAMARVAGLNAPTRQLVGVMTGEDALKLATLEHLTDAQLVQLAQGQGTALIPEKLESEVVLEGMGEQVLENEGGVLENEGGVLEGEVVARNGG